MIGLPSLFCSLVLTFYLAIENYCFNRNNNTGHHRQTSQPESKNKCQTLKNIRTFQFVLFLLCLDLLKIRSTKYIEITLDSCSLPWYESPSIRTNSFLFSSIYCYFRNNPNRIAFRLRCITIILIQWVV